MTETNATAEADAAGFTFKVGHRVFSETAPLGTVIQTDPEPGDRVLPGALIEGTVSKGPERHPVPKLRGLTVEEATAALRKERLRVGTVTQDWSDVIPKGSVRNLKGVKVGDRLKRNAKVSFVVSKGREPIQVVSTIGQTRGSAYYTLQNRGFLVAVRQQYSDRVAAGRVITQYPSSGTKYKGDTITITVSLGPERIKVPGVVGDSRDDAEDALKDAGFDVNVRGGDGKVLQQEPSGGEKAKVGSTVTIWAAASPEPKGDDKHKNR
jgi:serine/threonine-protein kinase